MAGPQRSNRPGSKESGSSKGHPSSGKRTRKGDEGTRFYVKQNSTIMDFLSQQMQGKSRTSLKQLLTGGYIVVNDGTVTNFSQPVKPGDVVTLVRSKKSVVKLPSALKIVYEDDFLMVVSKEAGLLSISSSRSNRGTVLAYLQDYVKQRNPKASVFLVHRLERELSGLMVFAKSVKIQAQLEEHLGHHGGCHRYIALLEGFVEKDECTVETWLKEVQNGVRLVVGSDGEGRQSLTRCRVIDSSPFFTLAELESSTGRKADVRAHMQHIGHPVAGDSRYGSRHNPIDRLAFHASDIEFTHPVSGKKMSFKAAVPPDFVKVIAKG